MSTPSLSIARTAAVLAGGGALLVPSSAMADVSAETQYVLNTLSFLYHGMLVLFMVTGFTMLEGGLVRTKSVSTILLKNITLIAIAMIGFWGIGYNLMFTGVDGGFAGTIGPWSPDDAAARSGRHDGAASASVWLFQCLFAVTAVSIISGTLAERIRLWPLFVFAAIMATLLYPIQGAWSWGGGWLDAVGFRDFAGGTHVHAASGWAALIGAVVLGPRRGRFLPDGSVRTLPASSLPLATLGTMVLWLGWLGFNGGSQGSMSSAEDVIVIAQVYANTTMASCGGIVATALLGQLTTGKVDLTIVLNGALAGLVSITAGPDTPDIAGSLLIGAIGATMMIATTHLLLKLRIDDVIGAVPVHLTCGLWGTVAVAFSNPATDLITQALGTASVSVFMIATSAATWLALRVSMRLRLTQAEEAIGIDRVETGALAYPEFATKSAVSLD